MSIKWTKSGYGYNGTLPGAGINRFKIYEPGDPCNYGEGYELVDYSAPSSRPSRTQHPNLEAAKRAARRQVAKARPRPAVEWDRGNHLCIGKYPDGTGWFIADDYLGSGLKFMAERLAPQTGDRKVFPTLAKAKAYCEKKGPK